MENVVNINEVMKGDVIVFRVKGKLDATVSPAIEKKAVEHIAAGHSKLLLDLTEVSYINSAGLRMLLSIKKQTKAGHGKFILCSLKNEVFEIIKICGFDHVLEIAKNEDEAMKQF